MLKRVVVFYLVVFLTVFTAFPVHSMFDSVGRSVEEAEENNLEYCEGGSEACALAATIRFCHQLPTYIGWSFPTL